MRNRQRSSCTKENSSNLRNSSSPYRGMRIGCDLSKTSISVHGLLPQLRKSRKLKARSSTWHPVTTLHLSHRNLAKFPTNKRKRGENRSIIGHSHSFKGEERAPSESSFKRQSRRSLVFKIAKRIGLFFREHTNSNSKTPPRYTKTSKIFLVVVTGTANLNLSKLRESTLPPLSLYGHPVLDRILPLSVKLLHQIRALLGLSLLYLPTLSLEPGPLRESGFVLRARLRLTFPIHINRQPLLERRLHSTHGGSGGM